MKKKKTQNCLAATNSMLIQPRLTIKAGLFLVCLSVMVWQSTNVILQYKKQPTATKLQFKEAKSVKFSNLQVCESNWMSQKKFESWNISLGLLEYLSSAFSGFSIYKGTFSNEERDKLDMEYFDLLEKHPGFDLQTFFRSLSIKETELIYGCTFEETQFENCSKMLRLITTPHGVCVAFLPNQEWEQHLPEQDVPGPDGAVGLDVDHSSNDSVTLLRNAPLYDGVFVSFAFGTAMDVKHPIFVPAGYEGYIEVKLTIEHSIRDCTEGKSIENFFKWQPTYSADLCKFQCLHRHKQKTCGCSHFYYGVKTEKVCTPRVFLECARPLEKQLAEIYDSCDCPQPCKSETIDATVSYARLESRKIAMIRKKHNEVVRAGNDHLVHIASALFISLFQSFQPDDIISLTIYHADIGYNYIEEFETMTWETFVSNIGGHMGLWLGISLFTAAGSVADRIHQMLLSRKLPNP